jgi:hypothetical protein
MRTRAYGKCGKDKRPTSHRQTDRQIDTDTHKSVDLHVHGVGEEDVRCVEERDGLVEGCADWSTRLVELMQHSRRLANIPAHTHAVRPLVREPLHATLTERNRIGRTVFEKKGREPVWASEEGGREGNGRHM